MTTATSAANAGYAKKGDTIVRIMHIGAVPSRSDWTRFSSASAALALVVGIAQAIPRGYASLPRWIGRNMLPRMRSHVTLPDGSVLAVDPQNLDAYTALLRTPSVWDETVIQCCKAGLGPRSVFFDIGANCGSVTIPVARATGTRVLSFEPIQSLAEHIATSAALNGLANVSVFPCAVGDESGSIELAVTGHSGQATTVRSGLGTYTSVSVPIITVDGLLEDNGAPPPDVMKIDVEGAEKWVLEGARETLCAYRPALVFECNSNLTRAGTTLNDIFELVRSCGQYRFFFVGDGTIRDADTSGASDNVLAVPNTRMDAYGVLCES